MSEEEKKLLLCAMAAVMHGLGSLTDDVGLDKIDSRRVNSYVRVLDRTAHDLEGLAAH